MASRFPVLIIRFLYWRYSSKYRWPRSCSKKNDKMSFSKKPQFLKSASRFKARYKKIMRFTHCTVQVGVRLCKKFFLKMCNIEANIEYFAFVSCFNLIFSQIEIIIKFLKNFGKEDLNFSQIALREGFYYRIWKILWLLSSTP